MEIKVKLNQQEVLDAIGEYVRKRNGGIPAETTLVVRVTVSPQEVYSAAAETKGFKK